MNKCGSHIVIFAALLLAWTGGVRGQVLDPITVSFSTETGEVENVLGVPVEGGSDESLEVGDSGEHFFLQGDEPGEAGAGLPTDGTIVSASNTDTKITTFQFAPYTGPNILVWDGTLTLATPAAYSNLAFLINSLSVPRASAEATFTLHFSDGSSDTLSTGENVPYWIGGTPGVAGGSVAYSNNALYSELWDGFDESVVNLDEYDFVLSAADAAKTLISIDVDGNGGELVTYAVSGTDPPLDTPEPSTLELMVLAFGVALLVQRVRPLIRR